MEVTFAGPVFFSQGDEALFFYGLEQLPGFISVVGRGRELTVALGDDREGAIRELLVLFRRWQIDPLVLQPHRQEDPYPSRLWEQGLHEAIGPGADPLGA